MKITYTPRVHNNPTNEFHLEVEFMHGDADAYTNERGVYETEAELIAGYKVVNKWLEFKEKYHNLGCNLCQNSKEELLKQVDADEKKNDSYSKKYAEAGRRAAEFLGEFNYLSEMFESVGIETPGDVSCDHQFSASLRRIISIIKFDENGNAFDISIEE